jgi:hypothetical protein
VCESALNPPKPHGDNGGVLNPKSPYVFTTKISISIKIYIKANYAFKTKGEPSRKTPFQRKGLLS